MKKSFLLIFLVLFSLNFFCLDPVGYSVFYDLSSNLKPTQQESTEILNFPESSFIKIHLSRLFLGEKDEFLISGKDEEYSVKGPFDGEIWLPSVSSDTVSITLKNNSSSNPFFVVDEIGLGLPQNSGRVESICENDDRKNPVCYDAVMQRAGDPVGRMLFQSGAGWYLCTGSIISPNSHFLTNNHCIEDQVSANTLEVWWRYQSSTCEGTTGTKEYVSTGAQFITTNKNLDFTLLQLTDPKPVQSYGYIPIDNRLPIQGERIWIPQHGGGSIKKFAVESDMDQGGFAVVDDDNLEGWIANSDFGYYADTEGGSSGSPVLDLQNKIIGIHHFGLPSGYTCGTYMNQAVKISLIYPLIADYIGEPIPPHIISITKAADPFRLIIQGENFKNGISVFIGSSTTPWQNVSYKGDTKIVLKKGKSLKSMFPKGEAVQIKLVNPDGGTAYTTYSR
ncbi:MAG: serine protease [Acidobacteriota bacterium]